MAFQRRLGLLLTGLTGGLLLLQNWVTPAQPTSLSGIVLPSAGTPLQVPSWGAGGEEGSLPF